MNVQLSGICKRFGAVHANADVDLTLRSGEVCALLGENGAGKSTLMKLLYGVFTPDSGTIAIDGAPVRIDSPRAARAHGIGMLFQQFSLIDALSVSDNLVLGARGVPLWLGSRSRVRVQAEQKLAELAPDIDPRRRVRELGPGEKQLVELSKVLSAGARLVILDEPTSLLARPEAERLWRRLRELASAGHAVVLITHKLEDIDACADRAVVLRAGRVVLETREVKARHRDALVAAMMGGALPRAPLRRPKGSDGTSSGGAARSGVRLRSSAVSAVWADQRLERVSFSLARGSILGVAGVTGNGQELLGRVLAGVQAPRAGQLTLDGQPLAGASDPRVAYVPEQPMLNAIARSLSLLVNLEALRVRRLPWWLSLRGLRAGAERLLERFDVQPRELDRPAGTLSGGNAQKLVLARELAGEPDLIVVCFPSMGLDAAACQRLVGELVAHAERGASVVWIGEDLDALLAHADEIAVLHHGRLSGPIPVSGADKHQLGLWMTGAAA
ncbi:MAG TPA: ATP-binding cassette domain-containing protein [Polyangiaceae bacterium]|nr:ATP-binding cassette domain-containing protein [Polyangiaceae bacterium]